VWVASRERNIPFILLASPVAVVFEVFAVVF
jgi:hypothetical protein